MALSPPLANSLTIAVIIPVPPSTTTEYCRSAVSCENDQGSTRVPPPGVRLTVCVKASEPPAKLYQLIVTVVAVTLCRRMGVLQPVVCVGVGQKQSDFVRFGRKNLVAGVAVAEYPIAVVAVSMFTWAAMVPPVASILIAYSPSARQSLPPVLHGVFVVPWVLNEKRGSNAFELFGAIDGYVYVFAVPGLSVSGGDVRFGGIA